MCSSVRLLFVLLITANLLHDTICDEDAELPCALESSIDISDGLLLSNGSVLYKDLVFSENEYFLHKTDNASEYRGCICLLRPCLRKCCPMGSIFTNNICVSSSDPRIVPFNPPVHDNFEHLLHINASDHFEFLFELVCESQKKYPLDPFYYEDDKFFLQADGTLFVPADDNYTNFCMELFIESPIEHKPWPDNTPQYLPVLCLQGSGQNDEPSIAFFLFPIGLLISSPFLLATFCVYAFIPELRNLHGKSLMNYVFGLFVGFVSLATNQIISGMGSESSEASMEFCHAIAFIIYFFLMLSFFWLNVMCFDIWLTFRGFKAPIIGRRSAEQRRFLFYCVYAWGSTLTLTSICLLLQYHPDIPRHIIKPDIGASRCWFEDRKRELLFLYIPLSILVIANLVLFSNTSLKIVQINNETAMLQSGDNARHDQYNKDKQRFNLYMKLFLVMGINWIAELLSFIIGGSEYIWIFSDCLNTILGVYIFIIFVWKKKIKNLIIKRYRFLRYGSTMQTRTSSRFQTTNQMSSVGETDKSFLSESVDIKMKDMV